VRALREGFTVERRLLETASSSRFWTALNGEADAATRAMA